MIYQQAPFMLGNMGMAFTLFILKLLLHVPLDSTYTDSNLRTFSRAIWKRVQMQMVIGLQTGMQQSTVLVRYSNENISLIFTISLFVIKYIWNIVFVTCQKVFMFVMSALVLVWLSEVPKHIWHFHCMRHQYIIYVYVYDLL